jgi:YHS domain-containing protein/thiol-disulfide isomerase/thioredoxin
LLGVAVVASWLVDSAAAQQAVRWQPTLETAKRVAAQTNQLLLIHFWGEGCPPCEKMEREVYTRPDVAAALQRGFVAVKVNRSYFPSTAAQFGVSAVPTDVIVTADGQLLEKYVGAASASQYIARLDRIAANWHRAGPGNAQLASRPSSEAPPTQMLTGATGGAYRPNATLSNNPYGGPPAPQDVSGSLASGAQRSPLADSSLVGPRYSAGPVADSRNLPPETNGSWPPAVRGDAPPSRPAYSPYAPQFAENAATSPPTGFQAESGYGAREPAFPHPTPQGSPEWPLASASPPPASQPGQPATRAPNLQRDPMAQTSPAVELPPGNPPLSLDGYCPVQLGEKKRWVLGNTRWGLRHEGRTYLFAGPEEQKRFDANPEAYAPAKSGNDVVLLAEEGQAVAGRREHGAWFRGKVYLFASEDTFRKFEASPEQYTQAVQESSQNTANRFAPPHPTAPWATSNRPTSGPY